jgi:hypothetical protein
LAIQGLETPGVKEINPEFFTGRMTTRDEIDRVVEVTAAAVKRLRGWKLQRKTAPVSMINPARAFDVL